jgi:hypothetical protein
MGRSTHHGTARGFPQSSDVRIGAGAPSHHGSCNHDQPFDSKAHSPLLELLRPVQQAAAQQGSDHEGEYRRQVARGVAQRIAGTEGERRSSRLPVIISANTPPSARKHTASISPQVAVTM